MFKYDRCDNLSFDQAELDLHIEMYKKRLFMYKYIGCNKTYIQKSHLNTHKKKYTGIKNRYDYCRILIDQLNNLKRHIYNIHDRKV